MIDVRMGKAVRRVVVLQPDPNGGTTTTTLYRRKRRKKKRGSVGVREVERIVRAMGDAQKAMTDDLVKRHKRSNRKRKDGWLYELGPNVYKASGKGICKVMNRAGL